VIDDELDSLRRLSVPARPLPGVSRRRFLQAAGAGVGGLALAPALSRLQAFAAPPIGPTDGVLVLINMTGGNDGLNTLCPVGDSRYFSLRGPLAFQGNQVLPVGTGFGLNPALPKLKARYDQGKVAVVRGVGYNPPDLSHFTSMAIWMNGWGGGAQSVATGWLGRWLDGLPNAASEALLAVTIGSSVPLHLIGAQARASGLPESLGNAFGLDRSDPADARMFDALSSFASSATGLGTWGDAIAKADRDTMDLSQRIQPAYQGTLPDSDLGRQLVLCARLVNANLGIRVLNTSYGNFDNHADEKPTHTQQMVELDDAIDAFSAALSPSYRNRVTLMTFSEFGRRPEANVSAGTDHGTASCLFVVGDRVRGGLYGGQPSLTDLDRNGNLKYTVDFRNVYATVLEKWLNADATQVLGYNFPKLDMFTGAPGDPVAGPAPPPSGTPPPPAPPSPSAYAAGQPSPGSPRYVSPPLPNKDRDGIAPAAVAAVGAASMNPAPVVGAVRNPISARQRLANAAARRRATPASIDAARRAKTTAGRTKQTKHKHAKHVGALHRHRGTKIAKRIGRSR